MNSIHGLDHRRFPVCWYRRGVPFRRWWWRIRIVSIQLECHYAWNPYTTVGFALWGRTERLHTKWYLYFRSVKKLLTPAKIDFRETAPGASDLWMYKNATDPLASTIGGLGLFILLP